MDLAAGVMGLNREGTPRELPAILDLDRLLGVVHDRLAVPDGVGFGQSVCLRRPSIALARAVPGTPRCRFRPLREGGIDPLADDEQPRR